MGRAAGDRERRQGGECQNQMPGFRVHGVPSMLEMDLVGEYAFYQVLGAVQFRVVAEDAVLIEGYPAR